MHVNQGRCPPGGPHYDVAPGVRLTAATFEDLYTRIGEYRARHGVEAGDPRADVDNYVCGRWPHFCQPEKTEKAGTPYMKISTRVGEWASKLIQKMPAGGFELVDTREAARRAEICRNCPFQESWRVHCTPCNASTDALLSTVRRMKKTGIDKSLQGCGICGIDNPTSVWLGEDVLRPTDDLRAKLPQNCWIKKIP